MIILLHRLLAFHILPFHPQRADNRQARNRGGDVENVYQSTIVRLQHRCERRGRDEASNLRRTQVQHRSCIEIRDETSQTLDQLLGEYVLRDAYANRSPKGLSEEDERDTGRDVLLANGGLNGSRTLLHTHAETESEDDLVADPLRVASSGCECGEEAGADGHDD